jgi:hypothetical protein
MSPTRREALDEVGLLQRVRNTRWKRLFLKSSKKLGRSERQLDASSLSAMLKQYITNNTHKRSLKISLAS